MSGHFISIEDMLAAEWPDEFLDRPADAFLRAVRVQPFDLTVDPTLGMRFETQVILGERVELGLPGIDLLRIGVGGSQTPVGLFAQAYPEQRVQVGPLLLSILIAHEMLVPMRVGPLKDGIRPFEPDPDRTHVSAEFSGAEVSLSSTAGIAINNRVVATVDPFMIRDTGLILALEGASVVVRDADWSPSLGAIGFDKSFRGVHAENATLHWLPAVRIAGLEIPGLRMEFDNVGIGNQGASFDLALEWPVAFDASGGIDPDRTELFGSFLDGAWQIALQRASGTVRVNIPEAFSVQGFLKVPFFDAVFGCEFGLRQQSGSFATHFRLFKSGSAPITLPFPAGTLTVGAVEATGFLGSDQFALSGLASFDADFDGLTIAAQAVTLSFSHAEGHDAFAFSIGDLQLGNFANLRNARLKIEGSSAGGSFEPTLFHIAGECRWSDLSALVPADMQVLSLAGEATLRAKVRWERAADDPAAPMQVVIELFTGVSHLNGLWDFLPPAYRPLVLSAESFFRVTYADTAALAADTRDTSKIEVTLSAKLRLQLPDALPSLDIPGMDLIEIEAGENGVISAEFVANAASSSPGGTSVAAGLVLEDLIAMKLSLPGGLSDAPFIETRFSRLELQAGTSTGGSADTVSGSMALAGDFAFRPFVPTNLPFAPKLAALLRNVGLDEIRGSATTSLSFENDDFEMTLKGTFEDAALTLDIFDMVSSLAGGSVGPDGSEINIDFDIRFALAGFSISMARDASGSPDDPFSFAFDLDLSVTMTGLSTLPARIRLSDEEFALGVTDIAIPLEMPRYPISVVDLYRITDSGGTWSQTALSGYLDTEIDPALQRLDDIIEAGTDVAALRSAERDRAALQLRKLLLQLLMQLHDKVGTGGHPVFQSLVHADTLVHETLLGILHFDTKLMLSFPEIKISIPFDNPDGIAIIGEGKIIGFAPNDPMKALEDYSLTLGLSSQYIFARLSGGKPIPIPAFGTPYDDGSVALDEISIAYGYSKNSFAFGFKGELVWPTQLIDDADTSRTLGAGLRLPRHNKVAFQLDTIVLTVGKVTLVIPLPQFDIDLRSPGAPAVDWDGNRRRPHWDGLELIVRNALHADLKHLAFSPFFGFVLAPNVKFSGDLEIGDARNGATLIIDELHHFAGLVAGSGVVVPVPVIFDPTAPFFRLVTANVRLAGFEVNFTLERPFPNPSPVAVFEAFGLISNPAMRIEPEGALANTFFIRMDNAYVRFPEYVTQMFPAAAAVVEKRYGFTLNLGTLITMAQQIGQPVAAVTDAISELNAPNLSIATALLGDATAGFSPQALLGALPPELRKFRVGGQVAGFEASACIVIASEAEARAAFEAVEDRSDAPPVAVIPPAPPALPDGPATAETVLRDMLAASRPNLEAGPPPDTFGGQRPVSGREALDLFKGIEFKQFDADDLARIPTHLLATDQTQPSVFFGARLRVAGAQRIRFFGRLFQNGSFAMISAAEARPLYLQVFGLSVKVPFAGYGRLSLVGGQNRTGFWGQIEAAGHITWEPIPGILRIATGRQDSPARLALFSDGRFDLAAPAKITLFGGAATIDGRCEVSQERAVFSGTLRYAPTGGQIALDITGSGIVNAVAQSGSSSTARPSFNFDAKGKITLLGREVSNVRVRVSDHDAAFDLSFSKPATPSASDPFPVLGACGIKLNGHGRVNLRRRKRPEFEIAGDGRISILGADLKGRCGLRARPSPSQTAARYQFEAWAKGDLTWQGRKWLGGRISVGSRGLRIGGQCRMGLKITPDDIPGTTVNLAHLFLTIGLEGEFSLNPAMNRPWFSFSGDWTLGAGMPTTDNDVSRQIVPLASDTFRFESAVGDTRKLFDISGFRFLPLDGFSFDLPDIGIVKGANAKTLIRAGKLKNAGGASATELWTPFGWLGMRNDSIVPYTGSEPMKSPIRRAYSAYKAEVAWKTVTLAPSQWDDLSLAITMKKDPVSGRYPMKVQLSSGILPPVSIGLGA